MVAFDNPKLRKTSTRTQQKLDKHTYFNDKLTDHKEIKHQTTDKQAFVFVFVFQNKLKTLKLLRVIPRCLDYGLGLNTYTDHLAG